MSSDKSATAAVSKHVAVIAGAGPAGLTAAYELLRQTNVQPIVCEASQNIGGISQTVEYHGNRMDLGGHRFFSKDERIMKWWQQMLPLQGARSKDDILLNQDDKPLATKGPDPEKEDRVMLLRHRVSRIFFLRKFFDYPISMKKETFLNMGLLRTMKAGFGYLWSCVHKLPEDSLENFYINRFGRPLYEMFFEGYTEKVWGVHPSKLGADWGSQRVKGLSIRAVLRDMLRKAFGQKDKGQVETSLIEQFIYPKYGPGQLWQTVADEVKAQGGKVLKDSTVIEVHVRDQKSDVRDQRSEVYEVVIAHSDGTTETIACDYFLSTMPIKDLIAGIRGVDVPKDVQQVASTLPYRDFITVGLLVDKMKIINETKLKTYANRVPDTWIYIQERDVKIGRLQVFNNWSPYLVKDYEHTMWIGLEYFATEGDALWQMPSEQFIKMATDELIKIDIIAPDAVLDACHVRVKKAYPAYYGSYYQLDTVKTYLNDITNLFCLGRNGQHRYNNMDHSMATALECVELIRSGKIEDKTAVWNVNTETEYHESKKVEE